jgi:hypothetical protein
MELRRQLEILGLSRFRQEVMPPDWRAPLSDTALSLATPDALIGMLERKLSPSKNACLIASTIFQPSRNGAQDCRRRS